MSPIQPEQPHSSHSEAQNFLEEASSSHETSELVGSSLLDVFDLNDQRIEAERAAAKRGLQIQGERMIDKAAKRLKPAQEGDSVTIPVSYLDRGLIDLFLFLFYIKILAPGEFSNLMGVVLESSGAGLYKLGTRSGVLKHHYPQTAFTVLKEKFVDASDVPRGKEMSLREAATSEAMGKGQGFVKCNCVMGCQGKCKCFSAGLKCNSRCHGSRPCNNKQ
jgi:hypothetical protein